MRDLRPMDPVLPVVEPRYVPWCLENGDGSPTSMAAGLHDPQARAWFRHRHTCWAETPASGGHRSAGTMRRAVTRTQRFCSPAIQARGHAISACVRCAIGDGAHWIDRAANSTRERSYQALPTVCAQPQPRPIVSKRHYRYYRRANEWLASDSRESEHVQH